ncbi:MAG: prolyl-tRNA synthetase [Candidatus Colwellbacteria bacterium CG10_big_fil_rev_8_21_14_0_10_41_28]|uniref:Proline--tRNA ligase n=1 Tax=Candidatus Colwellbacteria bacterium CG10_big_fil_rev_8_21_14_0_10_41_28 TaxID=1974539 RepID=A0A2H0VHB1_9BACT|nr:MAG: prolyl-tRNA synthetase [Candidatus Colwellbacteria bacterium CG10_big_fil_rev_8_21_14_0_10_41_28]
MKQSHLYTKTRKTLPSGEVAKNAQLLIKAGYIHKELAGVYAFLPLGIRVMNKIEDLIRSHMDKIGGQEILLSSLQDPELWKKNNRWDDDDVDIWFKDRDERIGFAWSHEEPMISMIEHHVSSYKDLPVYVYQFQNKFRNEPRAKSGLLRGREFIMKDLYSFTKNQDELDEFYRKITDAYKEIFNVAGIGDQTYYTFASGGAFTEFSHEFQTLSDAGEDTIYIDRDKKIAINEEVYSKEIVKELGLDEKKLEKVKSIETGNIFKFGTGYSEKLNLKYKDADGKDQFVYLGSYGIGLSRLMATVVEVLSDDGGIVWPESISPFQVHLIELTEGLGEDLYQKLLDNNIEVLYDDRQIGAGEKFNDADLIGIPWRLVVSEKTDGKVEIKNRSEKSAQLITKDEAIKKFI